MSQPSIIIEDMSDALFSCVYSWVNGHNLSDDDICAAAVRHSSPSSRYAALVEYLKSTLLKSPGQYEEQCNAGLIVTDRDKQKKNRVAAVASLIGNDETKAILCDAERINQVFGHSTPTIAELTASASLPSLAQMAPNQRADALLALNQGLLCIHRESDTAFKYNGSHWHPILDAELESQMAKLFRESDCPFSKKSVTAVVQTLKIELTALGVPNKTLLGFANGVFNIETGVFRKHQRDDWLLSVNAVNYSPAAQEETLQSHAQAFWKWLMESVSHDAVKANRLLAAFYMVLTKRYDWQLFLEITGPGGSGKSIFASICRMLVGDDNCVSASIGALEKPRERALLVGKSLILLPDMARYVGEGAGIKAITGGDSVDVDPKYKAPYSTSIPAVIVAVNNNAMSFNDRSGGISRRRVIFNFPNVVPEAERDPLLLYKIQNELPAVTRHLLGLFETPQEAKHLLLEQRKSKEALAVKQDGDSLVGFASYLAIATDGRGMFIGKADMTPQNPRRYLFHAYQKYMSSLGHAKPLNLTRFGIDIKGVLKEYGIDYSKKRFSDGYQTNVILTNDAEEWLN
ncbi:phage/plasmid primase, P4 family [Pantoea sp. SOD02]|uniref:DNA primase family protein n=1 Tax=Pantoea sp. SOD02 TaxID=2970818 RepID=UPI002157F711|nr:phage/plasmid primase, P4 family [Pantoea sp. SOD02]UVC29312.1 phage/plasmid primase, P4 family [Pantoea sp. SOD02]